MSFESSLQCICLSPAKAYMKQGPCLGFHINPGVAVGRIHGNMAKPVANDVDVHAGLQETSRRGMSNRMRAHSCFGDRGKLFGQPTSVAAHQIVDSNRVSGRP